MAAESTVLFHRVSTGCAAILAGAAGGRDLDLAPAEIRKNLRRMPTEMSMLSHQPMIEFLPRRRAIIGGLIATFALHVAKVRVATAQPNSIPSFQSGQYQFTIIQPRQQMQPTRLFGLDGKTIDLISFRGKPVLLNFWATWCPACRTELPILDRLQAKHIKTGLKILAVSEDRAERTVVETFIEQMKIRHLPIYLDPNGYVAFSDAENSRKAPFALYGMPITYAIAASGWVVGYMPGAADWNSAAATGLIEFLRES